MNIRKPIDERGVIVSVRIPRGLHRKAKQFARQQRPFRTTVSRLVSVALESFLKRQKNAKR